MPFRALRCLSVYLGMQFGKYIPSIIKRMTGAITRKPGAEGSVRGAEKGSWSSLRQKYFFLKKK